MPQTDAYQYLRDQLAGTARRPGSAGAPSSTTPTTYTDPTTGLEVRIPPILVLPAGLDAIDFVTQVEMAHGLDWSGEEFMRAPVDPSDAEQKTIDHAIRLMNQGFGHLSVQDYANASDMFSLCLILRDHFFYHHGLALARFSMGDFDNALSQEQQALELLRTKQQPDEPMLPLYQEVDFADSFYGLLTTLLLYTGRFDQARQMVDFIVQSQVFQLNMSYLDLAVTCADLTQYDLSAKLVEQVLPEVDKLDDPHVKDLVLQLCQRLLQEGIDAKAAAEQSVSASNATSADEVVPAPDAPVVPVPAE